MIYIGITAAIFISDFLIKNHMERTLAEKRPVVVTLSVLLTIGTAAVFALSLGTRGNGMFKAGLSMLLGGAFSNTYDRLKRKYVVDYFSFPVKWKWFSRIVFNLSDFGIIIGALVAALAMGKGN